MREFNLFKIIKEILASPKLMFFLFLTSSILLFMPPSYLDQLGISIRKDPKLHTFTGVIWIVASVALIISFVRWGYCSYLNARRKKEILSRLKSLSIDEISIFVECINMNKQSIILQYCHSAATSLVNKDLLLEPRSTFSSIKCPYTIPDFVWEYLKSKRDNLEDLFNVSLCELKDIIKTIKDRRQGFGY